MKDLFQSSILVLLMSLYTSLSWGMTSTFVCNPWTYGDGSKSDDSFMIEIFDDSLKMNKSETYKRVTNGGGSIIYILNGGHPFTLFIHDGDKGFIPHELVHSNSSFYLTEVDDPSPKNEYFKFFSSLKQTRCKKI